MDSRSPRTAGEGFVRVVAGSVTLAGELMIPAAATGIVVVVEGRCRPIPQLTQPSLTQQFWQAGLATLTLDWLTPDEIAIDRRTHYFRFGVDWLAHRLQEVTVWLTQHPATRHLKVAYLGTDTGGAAAITAAATTATPIAAIVARGSWLTLTADLLGRVQAPTLLIVGAADLPTLCTNQDAVMHLQAEARLELVPEATHQFREPGALQEVIWLASQWFVEHLPNSYSSRSPAGSTENGSVNDPLHLGAIDYAH